MNIQQKELAEKFGVTVCTVRNWEKNRSSPSLTVIPKIIEFLDYVPFDTSNEDFGKELAVKRRLLGLSQKAFASQIGVDPCTIRSWEKGRPRPHEKLLRRLASFLVQSDLPELSR